MAEVIDMHAAVSAAKKRNPLENDSLRATAKMVNGLLKQGQVATKNMRKEWPDNYRFVVGGEQWPVRRPRWRFSEVVNVVWSNIMTEVGIQTDSRPQVDYIAAEPSDFEFANTLKEINDANWQKSVVTGHGWQQKVATAIFKSKLYHVVHALIGWDEELENGIGDIEFKILDPYGCFWDPTAKNIGEARWFIYAEPRPTGELRKKYPEFKDFIKPDITLFDDTNTDGIDDTDIDRLWRTGSLGSGSSTDRADREKDQFGGEPMTLLIKCWMKDDTVEEIQQIKQGENGQEEIEFVKKLRFPKGRYIEVANNITLEDRENEFEDDKFPIATLVNYDYGEYAGENEVTHQRGPQNIINYVWSHILDQMKMAANPQTFVAHQDAEIVKKLTNEPGLVGVVSDPANVRREPGVGIAPGMFNILETSLALVDKVSGLQDVTRGAPQPGVTSGLMLEGFVEAAQTRPRLKNRSVDEFLSQVGHLMASRYLQFYSVPRVFRITNKEGFPEFVEFFVEETDEGKVANITRQAQQPDGTLGPVVPQQTPVKGIPDVQVVSGSSLPFARAQKVATAKELYTTQAIDREELLKAIDWPNAEEVIRRLDEREAASAEAAAAGEAGAI